MDRHYWNGTIQLCEAGDCQHYQRTFTLLRVLDEGSSAVCYEARHSHSGVGVLKEFYPLDAEGLRRDANGQLLADDPEVFAALKQEYLAPYLALQEACREEQNRDLATFLPTFELYHGCDERGNPTGTAYIWTPTRALVPFDQICAEIHSAPSVHPEHKLVTILTAVETLTRCICLLHSAGMLHRDIKPSNFGFVTREGDTLTQTLSMFDINSICPVYNNERYVVGTKGYLDPEAKFNPADNQTDIYAIGALLFHAIVISDETAANGYLYLPQYFSRLRDMVNTSRLIQASEYNSHPRLRSMLGTILQKCLCSRVQRYRCCEELLDDLQSALFCARPSDLSQASRTDLRWVLEESQTALDRQPYAQRALTVPFYLYQHPLYEHTKRSDKTIRVLLFGFGAYGQAFLDACLQAGQFLDQILQVTVVTEDPFDRDIYLSERPALADFFDLDGQRADQEDVYGRIRFRFGRLPADLPAGQAAPADFIAEYLAPDQPPHFIFAALGSDALNLSIAQACHHEAEGLGLSCSLGCVLTQADRADSCPDWLLPLCPSADLSASPAYAEAERMAFNTHLVWEKDFLRDRKAVRAEFMKPYNYISCFSNVLSIKYKLYSLGIDLNRCTPSQAAVQFRGKFAGRANQPIKDSLIWLEHRRWVTEKLCQGWTRLEDLEECAGGMTKDEKRKRHVCIVKSRPDQMLASEFCVSGKYDKWDTASDRELNALDDLDRMSVLLHRMYARHAKALTARDILYNGNLAAIQALVEGNKTLSAAFQEWFSCIMDIQSGSTRKVKLYKRLKNAFLRSVNLPAEQRTVLMEQVSAFDATFFPILSSMEYRNWKWEDVAMVDSIPFILTFSDAVTMVIPYTTGTNSELFTNVAAPMAANPSELLYLYLIDRASDATDLLDSLPQVLRFLRKKNVQSTIKLLIAYTGHALTMPEALKANLLDMAEHRIKQVQILRLPSPSALAKQVQASLRRRSRGKKPLLLEKNGTRLSLLLQGAGLYDEFSSYCFDSVSGKFHSAKGTDVFSHILKRPSITVDDLASFQLSSGSQAPSPEFDACYSVLWAQYHRDPTLWKLLCNILDSHTAAQDVLVSFSKPPEWMLDQAGTTHIYTLPRSCSQGVEKVLRDLIDNGLLERDSYVTCDTTDACRVTIVDRYGNGDCYDRIFSNPYPLMLPEDLSTHMNLKDHVLVLSFNDLAAREVQLPEQAFDPLWDLLTFFHQRGFINSLSADSGHRVSFTYGTRQIKLLMTTAGRMLEVYVYHKLKECGRFDDVVGSYILQWGDTGLCNEFDCIVTKGLRTYFIECKARPNISQDFYFKLDSLVSRFGINATAVLVADTLEQRHQDQAALNALQRQRGRMLNVVTIFNPTDIGNIGYTLYKMINGTYTASEV